MPIILSRTIPPTFKSFNKSFQVDVQQKVGRNLGNPVSFHSYSKESHIINAPMLKMMIYHGVLQRLMMMDLFQRMDPANGEIVTKNVQKVIFFLVKTDLKKQHKPGNIQLINNI